MADLETTQSKLRSTPTAGVSGEHSAYYRRLISAGYKGYIQGSIGGGSMYGAIGLGIGAIAGFALFIPTAGASLWLIPLMGGGMGIYGAHAFADIGKTAAIIADSADINEKRRYLLDRYYETPNEEEAKEIRTQLEQQHATQAPVEPFHWRPALIGAAIGITLAILAVALLASGIPAIEFMAPALEFIAHTVGLAVPAAGGGLAAHSGLALAMGAPAAIGVLGAASAAIGAMAGSVIGIDREYVRRWMDKAEYAVHEPSRAEHEIALREKDIQRIGEAAKRGDALVAHAESGGAAKIEIQATPVSAIPSLERNARPDPITPETIAGLKPGTQVRDVASAERVAGLQAAMTH